MSSPKYIPIGQPRERRKLVQSEARRVPGTVIDFFLTISHSITFPAWELVIERDEKTTHDERPKIVDNSKRRQFFTWVFNNLSRA